MHDHDLTVTCVEDGDEFVEGGAFLVPADECRNRPRCRRRFSQLHR
jgi:hypothetical protein